MSVFALRLDHGERITEMLNVFFLLLGLLLTCKSPNVFAIYTTFNSFLIQARSMEDMRDWIMKIDRNFNIERIEGNGIGAFTV